MMSSSRSRKERIPRPPGLTLAILAAMILFGGWSLLKFYIAWRLNPGREGDDVILYGSALPFDFWTYINGLFGVLVLLSAVFAWRGKPRQMQYLFQGTVLLSAVGLIAETIVRLTADTGLAFDSSRDLFENLLQCQVPLQIMVTLYIIWYCNRAPARAFYRQEPLKNWQLQQEETTS